MKRTTRYLLILAGFLVFLVLAPLIILYVTGYRYDFHKGAYFQTGALVVTTKPNGAAIYVDGKFSGQSPTAVRFLTPGEHEVRLEKAGFSPWYKRLAIRPGQATSAAQDNAAVYLFEKAAVPADLASGVVNFFSGADQLVYLTNDSLITRFSDGTEKKVTLPGPAQIITPSPDGQFLLLQSDNSTFIFDTAHQHFTIVSNLLPARAPASFDTSDNLWFLNKNSLEKLDWQKGAVSPIVGGVFVFTLQNDRLYYLSKLSGQRQLLSFTLANLGTASPLAADLPDFQTARIIASPQNQVLLNLDGTLYEVNDHITPLLSNVTAAAWDTAKKNLVISTPGELYLYPVGSGKLQLITRSLSQPKTPVADLTRGYVYFAENSELTALELDSRDRQNRYQLAGLAGKSFDNVQADPLFHQLYFLDGNQLKSIDLP